MNPHRDEKRKIWRKGIIKSNSIYIRDKEDSSAYNEIVNGYKIQKNNTLLKKSFEDNINAVLTSIFNFIKDPAIETKEFYYIFI